MRVFTSSILLHSTAAMIGVRPSYKYYYTCVHCKNIDLYTPWLHQSSMRLYHGYIILWQFSFQQLVINNSESTATRVTSTMYVGKEILIATWELHVHKRKTPPQQPELSINTYWKDVEISGVDMWER